MYKKVLLGFILGFFVLKTNCLNAQKEKFTLQKTESWIVFDGIKNNLTDNWINTAKKYKKVGFILDLHYDTSQNLFYHKSEQGQKISFEHLTATLLKNIQDNNNQYVLLFNIAPAYIAEFNAEISKIEEKTTPLKPQTESNLLFDILNTKRLLFFSFTKNSKFHKSVHFFYDYFETHHVSDSYEKQINSPTKAQAIMLHGALQDKGTNYKTTSSSKNVDKRQNSQNRFLENWSKRGLQPIFIVSDNIIENIPHFIAIAKTTNYTHSIHGSVTLNDVPMDYVYWLNKQISFSYGYFNFPISESKIFTPYRAGYEFVPKQIEVKQGNTKTILNFKANPISLSNNLQLKLLFNDSIIKDNISNTQPVITKCAVIKDKLRGSVLKVNKGGGILLGNTDDYKIKDNNFTISFWIKTENSEKSNHSIFGTNTANFREGLHIQMRKQAPYFGFFINDIWSEKTIPYKQWHHLAFTYDKVNKEKRIYIDGILTDVALDSPSFIGNDNLFIGKCLNRFSPNSFYIDNFMLWSRTLNESEIKSLKSEDVIYLLEKPQKNTRFLFWLLASILVLLCGIALLLKFKKPAPITKTLGVDNLEIQKNAILLFGNFTIIDTNGNNIVPKMSPLIKELFLKLLKALIQEKKGLSSQELTNEFWNDLTPQKARNNRNVAMARLRNYLSDVKGLTIEYADGKHCILMDNDLGIDYYKAEQYAKSFSDLNYDAYFKLVERGTFLMDIEFEWLEDFKEQINRNVTTRLLDISQNNLENIDSESIEKISKYILKCDDLNEYALKALLKSYEKQGKKMLMEDAFNNFTSTYHKVYGENFNYSMRDFLIRSSEF